jgi:hypothetical protein
MAGKRIEDLPAYGAIDTAKYKKDIYEVSKNSGTYGAPVYDPADSKQKTLEELAADIGAILPGGYIPLLEDNYLVVTQTDDPLESGENLRDAIAYAQAATPGGNPLDAQNRFAVLLFPGIYNLDATGINGLAALSNYVDIIGIGDAKDITVVSSDANGTFEVVSGSDYVLRNFTIRSVHISPLAINFAAASTDNGTWKDLILYGKTTEGTEFAGTYEGLNCQADEILNGSISGTVKNCLFASFSCGYNGSGGAVNITGKILNCIAVGSRCFGYTSSGVLTISGEISGCYAAGVSFGASATGIVIISGRIIDCEAAPPSFPSSSFGYSTTGQVIISGEIISCKSSGASFGNSSNNNVTISGRIIDCHLVLNPDVSANNDYAFGGVLGVGNVTISGLIKDCTTGGAGAYQFGATSSNGNITITGKIIGCQANNKAFGYGESGAGTIDISGIISDCESINGKSFGCGDGAGTNVNISGKIKNCDSGPESFGSADGTIAISGTIKNCTATIESFGDTTAAGKIIKCERTGGYGVHLGLISRCDFSENHATTAALVVGEGAVVRRSNFVQSGAGNCVEGDGAVNASVTYSQMNKPLVNITNSIVGAYNIGDGFVGTYFTLKSPDGTTWKFETGDDGMIILPGTIV